MPLCYMNNFTYFFSAVFLVENNSGKTSSGVKGVLCKFEIMTSAFSIFPQYFALTFTGDSITKFDFFNWGTTSYCFSFLKNIARF